MAFYAGDITAPPLTVVFDITGTPVDVDDCALTVLDPLGATVAGFPVTRASGDILHPSTGRYTYAWDIPADADPGTYTANWTGTNGGNPMAASETFDVLSPLSPSVSTTRAALETACRRSIRDATPSDPALSTVFTSAELADLIGEAIDQLFAFYPKEVTAYLTLTSGTYEYTMPAQVNGTPFRIDLLNADGTIADDNLRESPGYGQNGGWNLQAGTLYLPRYRTYTSGQQLRIWGYGHWTYIDSNSATSATTDLDQSALLAVRKYVAMASIGLLASDRVKFQQIQSQPETSDVGPIAVLQYYNRAKSAWEAEKTRLRRVRKNR